MAERLRIERVTAETAPEFVAYAIEHGPEHDDSFADADELRDFDPVQEIAFVARDGAAGPATIVGAASLMVCRYGEEGLGRLRVIHARSPLGYEPLVAALLAEAPDEVRHVFGFFFEGAPAIEVLRELGFSPTRYAVVLRRPDMDVAAPVLPEGVTLALASPEADSRTWADVINASFAGSLGRYDTTLEEAAERLSDERLLPGGAIIARRHGKPIGLTAVAQYDEDGRKIVWVDHLAVVPEAQGQGVGRALLRAAVGVARGAGFLEVDLSTGQANERALALYASEGFEVVRQLVCLGRDLER
jgi:mycothiol synthase